MNKKTLSQIKEEKLPIALYVTEMSIDFIDWEDDDSDDQQINLGGLIIRDGDIDDTYNWKTIVYPNGSRLDDGNACTDDVREVLIPLVADLLTNDKFCRSANGFKELIKTIDNDN